MILFTNRGTRYRPWSQGILRASKIGAANMTSTPNFGADADALSSFESTARYSAQHPTVARWAFRGKGTHMTANFELPDVADTLKAIPTD